VSSIIDALKAVVSCNSKNDPPFWIDGDGPEPHVLIACRNGLLHIETRGLLTHSARFFNINALPFDYDPQAPK
jgi:putative DNA primase/helicase